MHQAYQYLIFQQISTYYITEGTICQTGNYQWNVKQTVTTKADFKVNLTLYLKLSLSCFISQNFVYCIHLTASTTFWNSQFPPAFNPGFNTAFAFLGQ
jgi:hypothetical protein